jgi:hypothetical protein
MLLGEANPEAPAQAELRPPAPGVTPETVARWPLWRQLWNNLIAALGPVL